MNILGYMQSTLYLIMNALLYPVMGLLIVLFVLMLFISGAFVSEFAFRRKRNQNADQESEWPIVSSLLLALPWQDWPSEFLHT